MPCSVNEANTEFACKLKRQYKCMSVCDVKSNGSSKEMLLIARSKILPFMFYTLSH